MYSSWIKKYDEIVKKEDISVNEVKNMIEEPDYKVEYHRLAKENYMLKAKIEEYQKALLNVCLNKQ